MNDPCRPIDYGHGPPMKNPQILIVDDEANIRKILSRTLKRAGWNPDTAVDGNEAILKISDCAYDLVLLDLYMEPVDGLVVLEEIRKVDPETVVIILTAHGSMDSAVEALRLGVYDYLFKPATPDAIQLRVGDGLKRRQQILLRRRVLAQIGSLRKTLADLDSEDNAQSAQELDSRFLRSGRLVVDRAHRAATLGSELLDLTTTEYDILVCLIEAAPEARTSLQLVQQVMGYDAEDSEARNIIKWHIHQLRSKIEPNREKPNYIITVRYKGYLWVGG